MQGSELFHSENTDVIWRLIQDTRSDAYFNMALDEAILESVSRALSPPTLRFYQWSVPSISVGYFQKISDINMGFCREKGYPVVRRATGGMAILHDTELTYSFSARTDTEPFRGGLIRNYRALGNALVQALRGLNLDARMNPVRKRRQRNPLCFKTTSFGEITVQGHKVVGSAQRRYPGSFLQQGSILIDVNRNDLCNVMKRKLTVDDIQEIGSVSQFAPSLSTGRVKKALESAFEKTFGIRFSFEFPSKAERERAGQLEKERYSRDEWNFRR